MLKLRWLKLNAAARAESKTEAVSRSSRQKPEHVLQLSDVCLSCPLLPPPPVFRPPCSPLYSLCSVSLSLFLFLYAFSSSLFVSLHLPICLPLPLFSIYRSLCLSPATRLRVFIYPIVQLPPSFLFHLGLLPYVSFVVTRLDVEARRCIAR